MTLSIPTSNTNELIDDALQLLEQLHEAGTNYKKAVVMVQELTHAGQLQGNLFESGEFHKKSVVVNMVMDKINRRYGKNTLYFSTCGTAHGWSRQAQFRSPRYTTNWDELPVVS